MLDDDLGREIVLTAFFNDTMSLFNKPKRNIRRRPFNDEDEDNENRMEVEDAQPVKVKTKKKDKPKQTLLSFGEELEQGVYSI